jgi:hypothetical protein
MPALPKVSTIHFRRRIALASAAAAFLVGVLVTADVVLSDRPGATAEAAEVLSNAAAATIQTSDPVVGTRPIYESRNDGATWSLLKAIACHPCW